MIHAVELRSILAKDATTVQLIGGCICRDITRVLRSRLSCIQRSRHQAHLLHGARNASVPRIRTDIQWLHLQHSRTTIVILVTQHPIDVQRKMCTIHHVYNVRRLTHDELNRR